MKKVLSIVTFIALCTTLSPVYAMGGHHGNIGINYQMNYQRPMPPPPRHKHKNYAPPRNCRHSNTGVLVGGILGGAAVGVLIGSLVN